MRKAEVNRSTGETQVQLYLDLDGSGWSEIDTGIGFMDHMLVLLAKPIAPAAIASRTRSAICPISAGVASRCVASSPITQVRTDECPQ